MSSLHIDFVYYLINHIIKSSGRAYTFFVPLRLNVFIVSNELKLADSANNMSWSRKGLINVFRRLFLPRQFPRLTRHIICVLLIERCFVLIRKLTLFQQLKYTCPIWCHLIEVWDVITKV